MVVSLKRKDQQQTVQEPKTPLVLSVVLHIVVFLLVIFGLPHWKKEPVIAEPVPVELIANIGEMTTTNKPKIESPKPKKPKEEPPKKTEEKKKPPPPKPQKSTPPPPPDESLKSPPKPMEKPKEKVEKKPEPTKELPKKEETQPDFDSLLKDLAPEEKQQSEDAEIDKKQADSTPTPNVSRFSNMLSISEMDALRQQLSQCWSIMAGAQDSDTLSVEVSVVVNMDRTVQDAKIVDTSRYNGDPVFRAAADSAMRALRNPSCTPLNLPPEKYDQWHEMTIVFDPKEMF